MKYRSITRDPDEFCNTFMQLNTGIQDVLSNEIPDSSWDGSDEGEFMNI